MGSIACKFGGSSVACAERIRQLQKIVQMDERRRYIVVSAPGKRNQKGKKGKKEKKITDLLYLCHGLAKQGLGITEPFTIIRNRYLEIAQELGVHVDIEGLLDQVYQKIKSGASEDFVASRGEYLCARIIADYLEATFIDAAEVIRFRHDGSVDEETYKRLSDRLDDSGLYVIPGFYGTTHEGEIKTFTRGGSDITGSIVARAIHAEIYENWTDVSGFLMADPTIVEDSKPMRKVTYRELRELAYMGAKVFHEEAISPVYQAKIPINILNSHCPENRGTMISHQRDTTAHTIVGIAGKPGFSLIYIEKFLMNQEHGFGRRVLEILESHGISYEHSPTGIDSMSVIISDEQLDDKAEIVKNEIQNMLNPDRVEVQHGLALIATVGEGMAYRPGIAARLFTALGEAGVNVRTIDQGSSEINIIVGVEAVDYERAVRAIYEAFC